MNAYIGAEQLPPFSKLKEVKKDFMCMSDLMCVSV